MARKYVVRTFGCQMNEHDSERIAGLLEADGYEATTSVDAADVVVLNSCCIRENADNKLYGLLGHLKAEKARRPGLQIAVGGTAATTPFTRRVIQGSANSVSAVTPQTLGGTTYTFASWSDAGAQTHLIIAPATATTYRATYTATGPVRLPQSQMTVRSVDSQETLLLNGRGTNVLDGNPSSVWMSRMLPPAPMPHEIQLDLGASRSVAALYYLPRQSSASGRIANYEVYVSADGTTWGPAVATGTFPNSTAEQAVAFPAKSGRYVRLRALSEVNGNPWASIAELNIGILP
jgi:hypothetical protein